MASSSRPSFRDARFWGRGSICPRQSEDTGCAYARVLPPPGSEIASIAMEAFRANGVDYPRTTVVTDSPHARMSLLATGRFVTILPASVLKFLAIRAEIKALPVHLPRARVPNGIITLKTRTLSPVAQLFIDCAREVAKTPEKRK